jgi:hypothetical protein
LTTPDREDDLLCDSAVTLVNTGFCPIPSVKSATIIGYYARQRNDTEEDHNGVNSIARTLSVFINPTTLIVGSFRSLFLDACAGHHKLLQTTILVSVSAKHDIGTVMNP